MTVRAATTADHARIARICLLTGAQGDDATGRFTDDTALSDVYATPYLHGPGGFCLVWDVDGEACGYVLGTSDTAAFQRWFVAEWWPEVSRHHRPRTTDDAWLLPSAADPERMMIAQLDEFPAHLHIDLLPECQGKGVGRAMIEAACALLAERGVPGVHLGAERANAGAQAFYPRVGFVAVDGDDATVTFARRLAHGGASA
ncbi:GNAT family N-acetyltransferase [Demequina sp.]|uniref:GNAT family N-acetyltransferase n=1 Tax=Demequina sp. TaxID=2050685 RepID=UPI0025DDC376|nr:GNAT family N-acetyltransferase [Demequina sp.]